MSLCLSDLENKITQDAPCHLSFFNELFDLLSQLKAPYPYDSKNWADPNNEKNRVYLNKELLSFATDHDISEGSPEWLIFDSIRHAFISFLRGGVLDMYLHREAEVWYPKVIIKQFYGKQSDIDDLDEAIAIYRGTSLSESESGNYGQSWSLSIIVAKEFAYKHYSSQNDFDLARRVVISTQISKSDILYYDKTNSEKEVIVRVEALHNIVTRVLAADSVNTP